MSPTVGGTRPDDEHARTLLARIREDDAQAMDAFVALFAQPLTASAATVVDSFDMAQDIAQDVFLWLWDHRHTLDVRGSVLAYLVRAVRNRALTLLRNERTRHTYEAHDDSMSAFTELPPLDPESDFHTALEFALRTLPPRMREIFLLRADLGMSAGEVADALGIGRATVHNQMSLALKALAERLRPWRDSWLGEPG